MASRPKKQPKGKTRIPDSKSEGVRRLTPRRLTARQSRFIDLYLIELNATKAYLGAYKVKSEKTAGAAGARMLKHVRVAAEIAKRQAERAQRVGVTQDWVVERLRENVERAMQTEPVLDHDGCETGEYTYEGAVANGALALLGKHLGMFVDRVKFEGSVDEATAELVDIVMRAKSRRESGLSAFPMDTPTPQQPLVS